MSSKINRFELEQYANSLRQEMYVLPQDPVSIHGILRRKGIVASFMPLQKGFEGMAVKIDRKEKDALRFMMVNTNSSYARQRFTACHELYHLLYQRDFSVSYEETQGNDSDDEEKNADYFASCLLLPTQGLMMHMPFKEQSKNAITLLTVLKLEQNFRCSRTSLLYRLKTLGLITSEKYDLLKDNVITSALDYGYSKDLYLPTGRKELAGDYNLKAREMYDKGMISQSKYFELLWDMGIDLKKEKEA